MLFMLKLVVFLAAAAAIASRAIRSRTTTQQTVRGERTLVEKFLHVPTAIAGALGLVALMVGLSSFGTLDAGERGVVLRFGAVTGRVLESGLYAVTPLIESVQPMDVRVQATSIKANAASRDIQEVTTTVTLNWRLDPAQVDSVWSTLRNNYIERVIQPSVFEAIKASTATFAADSLITSRPAVREHIRSYVTGRLAPHGILVDDVAITEFQFSDQYTKAIEAKVTATQEAMKAENDLKRVQFEAEQQVATARAQAEAIRIQAQAITQQGGKEYVALKAIEKWNGSVPQWMSGGGSPVPFVNMTPPTHP